ncbi:MAG: hypothetical protein ICV60_05575 [Pyrinomonadaceae bacterium]|nr:hypothetical protein [Pyrinomonadaceae bacterium]
MNFKAYDILASLIPGFLFLLILFTAFGIKYDKDLIIAYTAIAFLFGYLMNAIGSWLEGFYFFTWGGKPSSNLLAGKDIWKVNFYDSARARTLLMSETENTEATNDELFSIAMRNVTGLKDSRIEDFNALYAFSRGLLTTALIGTITLLIQNYNNWRYYAFLLPILLVIWLRCKQNGYYYAREVLNEYLNVRRR